MSSCCEVLIDFEVLCGHIALSSTTVNLFCSYFLFCPFPVSRHSLWFVILSLQILPKQDSTSSTAISSAAELVWICPSSTISFTLSFSLATSWILFAKYYTHIIIFDAFTSLLQKLTTDFASVDQGLVITFRMLQRSSKFESRIQTTSTIDISVYNKKFTRWVTLIKSSIHSSTLSCINIKSSRFRRYSVF